MGTGGDSKIMTRKIRIITVWKKEREKEDKEKKRSTKEWRRRDVVINAIKIGRKKNWRKREKKKYIIKKKWEAKRDRLINKMKQ